MEKKTFLNSITKEELLNLLSLNFSILDMAKHFNCGETTIRRLFKIHNIIKPKSYYEEIFENKELFESISQDLLLNSRRVVSEKNNISLARLTRLIKKYNLPTKRKKTLIHENGKKSETLEECLSRINVEMFLEDLDSLLQKDIRVKYNISENMLYKLINVLEYKNGKKQFSTEKFIANINSEEFVDFYIKNSPKETSHKYDISMWAVLSVAKHLGCYTNNNKKRESYSDLVKRLTAIKDEFVEYCLTHSRKEIKKTYKFHERRFNDIFDLFGIERPKELRNKLTREKCMNKYGVPFACMREEARISKGSNSKPNLDFLKLLENNNLKYEREFSVGDFQYDFKINNILIEINPARTHSVDTLPFGRIPFEKDYHKRKTDEAINSKYRCIHIFDWENSETIISSTLLEKEKVYARKCKVQLVSKESAEVFLTNHHIQGYAKDKIRIGLFYKNELISLMTFGKPRYNKKYEWELVRYCSNKNVVGGSEKLFKHFIEKYNPLNIISYCDMSKFTGETYTKLGFKLIRDGKPSCHWYNQSKKHHITDNLLRQQGFDRLFGTTFGKGTSNAELMLQHGYIRIYDCGQKTFIFENKNV